MATATMMTVEEFAQMRTGELEDYELVEGELIPLSSGKPLHGIVRDRLGRVLGNYFERKPIGGAVAEVDCRVAEYTVRRPDLSVFLGPRALELDLDTIPVPYTPDIAVEVLSPSESAVDVHRKTLDYLAGGVQEVWILDTANCEIFIQTETTIQLLRGDRTLTSPLLPGFSAVVSQLLAAKL